MKTISIGVNAFGFNDSVNGVLNTSVPDRPVTLLLRKNNGRRQLPLVGKEAASSRIQTGFHWPEESRLPEQPAHLRRLPVSLLWENLVHVKGRPTMFGLCSTEELIAAHIESVAPYVEGEHRVISVPNTLSTASQERLLRAFGARRQSVSLLWRPVAAVLGWLNKVPKERIAPNSWIAVCYLGADGIEFTPLKLDVAHHPSIVVPIRSRPKKSADILYDGFQLAASYLDAERYPRRLSKSPANVWQAMLRFPDVWHRLQGRDETPEDAVWSDRGKWTPWMHDLPSYDFGNTSPALSYGGMPFHETFAPQRKKAYPYIRWVDALTKAAHAAFDDFKNDESLHCAGMIVCGGLVPANLSRIPLWLTEIVHSLGILSFRAEPTYKSCCIAKEDLISAGARIYGERCLHNLVATEENRLPTFFDTLPQISLYVSGPDGLFWQKLFNDEICEGGKAAENTLEIFSLQANSQAVEIWLQMSEEDDEAVDAENRESTPYRFSLVTFEKVYPLDIPLKLIARMMPSSGFASVFFKPVDPAYNDIIRSNGVSLNFEEMEPKLGSELPRQKRTYPPEGHRELISTNKVSSIFTYRVQTDVDNALVKNDLNVLTRALTRQTRYTDQTGAIVRLFVVDETGKQAFFDDKSWKRIRQLIIKSAINNAWTKTDMGNVLKAASYLWRGCPSQVRAKLFEELVHRKLKVNTLHMLGYAARVASTQKEFTQFLSAWTKYVRAQTEFKQRYASILTNFIDFQPEAAHFLSKNPSLLTIILEQLNGAMTSIIVGKVKPTSILLYQWLPSLLAALLKVRKWDRNFIGTDNEISYWCGMLSRLKQGFIAYCQANPTKPAVIRSQDILLNYYQAIEDYLKRCGNNVPLLSEDLDTDGAVGDGGKGTDGGVCP